MALTDWYEIKDLQTLGAAGPVMNVYHVMRSGALITSNEINQAFVDWVLPNVVDVQSATCVHVTLETRNLGDPNDFQTVALGNVPGGVAGEGSPTFSASRVQFLRERTDMKHGWKRFPGLPETLVNFNTGVASLVTTLQNIADAITAPWEIATNPGVSVCRFGIIARVCAEFDAAGACVSYRLPENDAELEFYIPDQGLGRTTIGSQNSRKQ